MAPVPLLRRTHAPAVRPTTSPASDIWRFRENLVVIRHGLPFKPQAAIDPPGASTHRHSGDRSSILNRKSR
jgi:hypothetical protein